MTPTEHYAEAERLLEYSRSLCVRGPKFVANDPGVASLMAQLAQVHATLALHKPEASA